MDIYTPFTYIIGWSQHKKFYYGAKYAQGCHPSDLWESYFTSSEYVEEFRKMHGDPDIIRIHKTFSDKNSCILFESEYLNKIDAKNNNLFLNKSNGFKYFYPYEELEEKRKKTCLKKYGYTTNLLSPETKRKIKETNLKKYGVDHPSKASKIKQKTKKTCLEKYGTIFHKEKFTETLQKNYGKEYINPSQIPEIKEKKKETNLNSWGYEFATQSPKIKQKTKKTCLEKYNVDNVLKFPEIKEKIKETTFKKYGVDHHWKSPDIQEKKIKNFKEKHGVDNPSKVLFFSIIETKKSYAKNILSRYYPEFKQYY